MLLGNHMCSSVPQASPRLIKSLHPKLQASVCEAVQVGSLLYHVSSQSGRHLSRDVPYLFTTHIINTNSVAIVLYIKSKSFSESECGDVTHNVGGFSPDCHKLSNSRMAFVILHPDNLSVESALEERFPISS